MLMIAYSLAYFINKHYLLPTSYLLPPTKLKVSYNLRLIPFIYLNLLPPSFFFMSPSRFCHNLATVDAVLLGIFAV